MNPISPSSFLSAGRVLPLALLAVALLGASGCRWMRGDSGYERSPEARPLEVPPELDAPRIDPTMNLPTVAAPAAPRTSVGGTGAADASGPFTIADTADSAWQRVGTALGRIDGVEITERAQVLGAYGVRYRGAEFLIRVGAEGDGSRISAATPAGAAEQSQAASALLGQLKQRLG